MIEVNERTVDESDLQTTVLERQETKAARAARRLRSVVLTSGASLASRMATILSAVVLVPVALGALGKERYGLWITISSVTALTAFADLGIGNGILNVVARLESRDGREGLQRNISTAFWVLTLLTGVAFASFCAVYPFVSWADLFSVKSPLARAEARPAVMTFVVLSLIVVPLSIVQKIQTGMQKGYIPNFWLGVASILGLGTTCVVLKCHGGPALAIGAQLGTMVAVLAMNWGHFYATEGPGMLPVLSAVDPKLAKGLIATGLTFAGIQLVSPLTQMIDNLLVARFFGIERVAEFSVANRLMAVASMLPMLYILPMWPAFAEANARNDQQWIRNALLHVTLWTVVFAGLLNLGAVAFGPWVIQRWVGNAVKPGVPLLAAAAAASFLVSANGVAGTYLMATEKLKFSLVTNGLMLLSATVLKIATAKSGALYAIPCCTALVTLAFINIPTLIYAWRQVKRRIGEHGLGD
jgi:O-antigen/teichoic acid export membrane protein